MSGVLPPAIPNLPGMDPKTADYHRRVTAWANTQISAKVDKREAVPQILLLAPNGQVYALAVSNSGALTTTSVVLGGSP